MLLTKRYVLSKICRHSIKLQRLYSFLKKKKGTHIFFSPNKPGGLNITCKCLASIVHKHSLHLWGHWDSRESGCPTTEGHLHGGQWRIQGSGSRWLRRLCSWERRPLRCPPERQLTLPSLETYFSGLKMTPHELDLSSQVRGAEAFTGGHDSILSGSGGLVAVVSGSLPPHELRVALQAPLSVGFPRQEYWSGLLFLSPSIILFEPKLMLFLLMFYKNKWTQK